jgi:amidase
MPEMPEESSLEVPGANFGDAARTLSAIAPSEWDYCPVRVLREALDSRKLSALELVDHTIARIEALDPRINAVVVHDFDRARAEALAADADLALGVRRPLLGIPMTIKEAFNVAGLPTTWGQPQFRGFRPKCDATVVTRAKRAGGVFVGKTNVPLGLGDFQSYNDLYGATCNPWDVSRSPGGSSGGSAAALAAGFGPLSFGSDIGGSLRVPAHFCGVYAHKPTFGLVPMGGYGPPPLPPPFRHGDLAVVGPMARTAADLALALEVIAGPDDVREGIAYRLALPPPRHDKLSEYRVLVMNSHPLLPTDQYVRAAIDRLTERLAKAGVQVLPAEALLPDLTKSARLYMRLLGSVRGAALSVGDYGAALKAMALLTDDDHSLAAERVRGTVITHRDWIAADVARARLREQWRLLFEGWDIVLCPPCSVPAFPTDHSLPIEARRIEIDDQEYSYNDVCYLWADPATTCGLPSTVAPIDSTPAGLPIGVEIIGPQLCDRMTIAFAGLLEREFGGFTPPPGYAG